MQLVCAKSTYGEACSLLQSLKVRFVLAFPLSDSANINVAGDLSKAMLRIDFTRLSRVQLAM